MGHRWVFKLSSITFFVVAQIKKRRAPFNTLFDSVSIGFWLEQQDWIKIEKVEISLNTASSWVSMTHGSPVGF